jgi:rhodanese-related sulfurtransferase
MSYQNGGGYAADLLATDAYALLAGECSSFLIDVRTQPEWAYVGVPDLASLGKTPFFLEWQSFPSMRVEGHFAPRLEAMLRSAGVERGATLVFLCRSGARSRHAAVAMTSAGWAPCINVSDGFEGPLDGSRQRGRAGGWKAVGLPWVQT